MDQHSQDDRPWAGYWRVRRDLDGRVGVVNPSLLSRVDDYNVLPTSVGVPPLEDKWNITNVSNISHDMLQESRCLAANAGSIKRAEQRVFCHLNQNERHYEKESFPELFSFGLVEKEREVDLRFNEYVRYKLRNRTATAGNLKHNKCLMFMANRAAILRHVMKRPPMFKDNPDQELDPPEADRLQLFSKTEPTKCFCYRYLLGDKEAAGLAMLYMHDYMKKKQSKKKEKIGIG